MRGKLPENQKHADRARENSLLLVYDGERGGGDELAEARGCDVGVHVPVVRSNSGRRQVGRGSECARLAEEEPSVSVDSGAVREKRGRTAAC